MVSTTNVKGERFAFSADINKLLGLIINTFYKNIDVFLREMISNSSDAVDKIKFQSLTNSSILGDETDFKVQIIPNKEAKTLTVRDNGIGMTKDDLIKNLGTIANSGTKAFMDAIQAGADIQMIGQFGVGFYSTFLVSDKVVVRSKHNDDKQHVWESAAGGEFDVYDDSSNPHQLKRGTEIVLHMKDDKLEYLEERRLKEIVKEHSEFVGPKIFLFVTKEEEKEVTDDEAEDDKSVEKPKIEELDDDGKPKVEEMKDDDSEKKDDKSEKKDDSVQIEEVKDEKDSEKPKKKTKKITEVKEEFELLNSTKPIWAMKPEDVKKEDYNAFYKTISNDWEEPLAHKHFHVEGQIEFTGIIFIPKRAPFDLFNNAKKNSNIRLYVRRVFINDDSKDLCPEYLSFVRGVIDSEEMPLNISRETLQQNKIMKIIQKNIVKKSIELITELMEDKEKYDTFHKNFSKNLKLGVHEDSANRAKLAKLVRFNTTKGKDKMRTLDDYKADMPSHQKDIYYITGESREALENLPFMEQLIKKDFEVLMMTDPIDEYFVQQLTEFDGCKLVSITKEGLELPMSDEEKKAFEAQKTEFEPLCKRVKEILGNRVEKVEVSNRMTESPCYISTGKYGWSSRMEQIMKSQALRDTSFSGHMKAKKHLCLNPSNAIVAEMARRFKDDTNDAICKDLVFLIYETALLTSGGLSLEKPVDYANRIFKLTRLGLNIVEEEKADELPPLVGEDGAVAAQEDAAEMEEVD